MIELKSSTREISDETKKLAEKSVEKLLSRSELGFHQICEREYLWEEAASRGNQLRDNYEHLVVVGMGGCSLGPKAIIQALGSSDKTVSFINNVDAVFLSRNFEFLVDLEKTHWAFISKTGGTRETLSLVDFISQYCESKNFSVAENCTVISESVDNLLTKWAKEKNIPMLEFPLDIGGRFAVLSAVGMMPAAFAGHAPEEFKKGAEWTLQNQTIAVELVAEMLSSFADKEWITAFWSYCSLFENCGDWVQQLWAESLSKKLNRNGGAAPQVSTPLPLVGSTDQHSIFQQMTEGHESKFVWFIRVLESETFGETLSKGVFSERTDMDGKRIGQLLAAFAESTQEALLQTGTKSLTLKIERLDASCLGAFFMLMEMVVGGLGEALEINAFDQPGVELGKKLVTQYL